MMITMTTMMFREVSVTGRVGSVTGLVGLVTGLARSLTEQLVTQMMRKGTKVKAKKTMKMRMRITTKMVTVAKKRGTK